MHICDIHIYLYIRLWVRTNHPTDWQMNIPTKTISVCSGHELDLRITGYRVLTHSDACTREFLTGVFASDVARSPPLLLALMAAFT